MHLVAAALVTIAAAGAGGCVSDVDDSGATGMYTGDATVTSSRSLGSFVTYGQPLRSWKVRMIATDDCAAPPLAELEINLTAATDLPPPGVMPFRTATNPLQLPSALFTSATATLLSGTVTIDAAQATRLEGSFSAMVMIAGAPQTVTGSFVAPTCAP